MQSDKLIKSFRLTNSYKKLRKIVVLHFIQTKMFICLKCHSLAGTYYYGRTVYDVVRK